MGRGIAVDLFCLVESILDYGFQEVVFRHGDDVEQDGRDLDLAVVIGAGRDHGPSGFSTWMAGGGVKRGYAHGATDDLGHKAVEGRVSVHDFHATLLHLLGLNFRDLVYERNGLKDRITDQIPARVVSEILA